jgi:LPXTG-motif cell wall-anchored protein
VLALLNIAGIQALADGPALSAQPVLEPGTQGSSAGGSASATPGTVGPATVASSQPVTASSSNSAAPGTTGRGVTRATAPGTTATVPTNAAASNPNPSAPDGSTPSPETSGPGASADASRSSVSTSDSRVRANLIANATGAFGGRAAGIGSAQDPTNASTCSSAGASPGIPTDVNLATACGAQPTTVSEQAGANGADGSGGSGAPSGSACYAANGSLGASQSADMSGTCPGQSAQTSAAGSTTGNQGTSAATTTNGAGGSGAGTEGFAASVLGLASLPSTATRPLSATLLGGLLAGAGALLHRRSKRQSRIAVLT